MADIKVRVGQQGATKVISSLAGAQTLSLAELSDVNIAGTEFRHQRRKFLKWLV